MKFLIFTCSLLITSIANAQANIEPFLSVPFPTELKSSKDGKTIAWVFNNKGVRNIFTSEAPAFEYKKITSFTDDDGMEITNLEFTPDNNNIIFVKGNAPNTKGEPANPAQLQYSTERTLWIIKKSGDSLKKIAVGNQPKVSPDGKKLAFVQGGQVWLFNFDSSSKPAEKLFSSRGSQNSLKWSPDGSMLAFVSARDNYSFIGVYHLNKKQVQFIAPGVDIDIEPAWAPDGASLAFIRIPPAKDLLPFVAVRERQPWSIHTYNFSTSTHKEIWKASAGKGSALFTELPTENLLMWTFNNQIVFPWEKNGWQLLYSVDPATGKTSQIITGEGEIENVTISNDRKTIFYATNIGDVHRRHIWKTDLSNGKTVQITKGDGAEFSPVITQNGLAVFHSTATRPSWPAIITNTGEIKDIAIDQFPKSFPHNQMVIPQVITITATDGMQVPAQLFLPKNYKQGQKAPAIIYLHGGSRRQMLPAFHYSQYYSHAYALNQYFASQGYVVLSVNYRSGIGYGMEFREALDYGATGASEVNDVIGAGLYLRSRPDVDPAKIGLYGGSYGGYLTAFGLAKASDLFAAGVDIHGVHDWNEGIRNFVPKYNPEKRSDFSKKAFESSPLHYVNKWRSPVLLIHGDDDRNVNFNETVTLAEQLRARNVIVEQLVMPDEVHSFLLHRNWLQAYNATFNFLDKHLNRKNKSLFHP